MEKNIKEAISIIEDVRKSMPECTNKAFLKGALNELSEALRLYDVSGRSELLIDFCSSMQFHFIATEQDSIKKGVDEYLKSINSH